jgi:hypothetical protein
LISKKSSPLKPLGQMNQNLVVSIASYQISVHLGSGFRGEDFLEIDQSKTRMACGDHVC